ncbi:polyketide synthase PksD [Xylaria scruposa]|nr:polyketide synthase PksD [Xylaria scruposa]
MEPIAIIGFSFKFPQGAEDESSLWEILESGRNVMTAWPEPRGNAESFYSSDTAQRNVLRSKGAHFLQGDISAFDAPFFSLTSEEASSMDPQQRLLLETSYLALENAGITMDRVSGTQTSVFSGSMTDDYARIVSKDPDLAPRATATGSALSILANRLSWYYNLKGPSIQVNTACSSSMIAVDLACQSLRAGQSSMSLVTGSSVILSPENSLYLSNMNFISPDSVSYSFDHRANGYGRGEGVVVLVLKLLADASRDGDMIRAVIRATGSNQDGYTPGLTQPSALSQEQLIRSVYRSCNLSFDCTHYVEAHGTGTQIGDSTEVKALTRVFRESRPKKEPLYIGSIKANIGHLEGASGLAGIIKGIMILEKGIIPPNPFFERWNPKINAKSNIIEVPTSWIPWPSEGLRRISINSFGFGGSNGHIILDDAYHALRALGQRGNHHTTVQSLQSFLVKGPSGINIHLVNDGTMDATMPYGIPRKQEAEDPLPLRTHHSRAKVRADLDNSPHDNSDTADNHTIRDNTQAGDPESLSKFELLVWSAKDEYALKHIIHQHSQYFQAKVLGSRDRLSQFGYTLAARRGLMAWRSFAVVSDETTDSMESLASSACRRSSQDTSIAFIFTGQGSQYLNMGIDLLHYPDFRSTLVKTSEIFQELGAPWSLFDVIQDDKKIHSPDVSQPLCTALQLSLVTLLRALGIVPAAVIGHSSGEIAAAYTIGALSLEAACKVAYHRGRLAKRLTTLPVQGSMISVNISEENVHDYMEKTSLLADIHVACVNSPFNVTLSGPEASIDELQVHLEQDNIFSRKLNTGVAYHSPAMQEIASEYVSSMGVLDQQENSDDNIMMISTVNGEIVSKNKVSESQYWAHNLTSTVRFVDALRYLALVAPKIDGLTKVSTYLEVGPHCSLRRPINDTLVQSIDKNRFDYAFTLSKFESPLKTILEVTGRLFSRGYPVLLTATEAKKSINPPFLVDLPGYPFNHSRTYWHETRLSREWRFRKESPRFLGVQVADWNSLEPRWRKMLSIDEIPWIADHVVGESTVFPATGSLMMAVEAVKQMNHGHQIISGFLFKEAVFKNPIIVRPGAKTELITQARPLQNTYEKTSFRYDIRIFAVIDGYWNECLSAILHAEYQEAPTEFQPLNTTKLYFRDHDQTKNTSIAAVSKHDFYKWHYEQGLRYGPAFMLADDILYDGSETGMARIDVVSVDLFEGVVHPAVMDAACQICFVAPSEAMSRELQTMVPHRMQDIWISATGWQYPDTRHIQVFAVSKAKTLVPGLNCSFKVLADDGTVLSHCKHLDMLAVVGNTSAISDNRKMFHCIDWKPQLSLMTSTQLQSYCDANHSIENKVSFTNDWNKLQQAIRKLTFSSISELRDRDWLKMPSHAKKYLSALKRETEDLAGHDVDQESLAADMEYLGRVQPSWNIYVGLTQDFPSFARGEVNTEEFFFARRLLFQEITRPLHSSEFMSFMDLIAHETPDQKILEVGSGTGTMTSRILSTLWQIEARTGGNAFSEYLFTDLSATYFEKAKNSFARNDERVSFRTLDMEQDLVVQGFEYGVYDTILAGSVLTSATSVVGALRNLRTLLKPGGHLIISEITVPGILGTLSNFCSSEDAPRPITESEWDIALRDSGFSGNELVIRDSGSDETHLSSVIVSSTRNDQHGQLEGHRIVVVLDKEKESQQDLALSFQNAMVDSSGTCPKVLPLTHVGIADIRPTDYVVFLGDLGGSLLSHISETTFNLTQQLIQRSSNLLWITTAYTYEPSSSFNPYPYSGLKDGFLRTIRSEFANKRIVSLSIENVGADGPSMILGFIRKVLDLAFVATLPDIEYIVRGGLLLTGRLVEEPTLNEGVTSSTRLRSRTESWLPGPPLKLEIESPGSLETLRLVEDQEFYASLGPTEVEIETKAWGVSFRDVFIALGRLEEDDFGTDCAGIVTRIGSRCQSVQPGDRVCMFGTGCMRMWVRSDEQGVVKIPDSLPFHEACAIVSPGITAWHSLVEIARLQKGDKVLIHSASGATGQLAVQVAQLIGAEIFATVGYNYKKQLLIDAYGIPEDHILYSRNLGFAKGIMHLTNGYGVDVVLNSLVGESLRASLECIAPYGRFIEIGKADIKANSALPMGCFARNVSFSGIDLHHLAIHRHDIAKDLLQKTMELARNGSIHPPTPLHVYDISKVEEAFRFFQSGKNTGRVIIQVDRSTKVPKCLACRRTWMFNDNSTYILVGGLGGIGRAILKWMVTKGAKYLVVPSRSGATTNTVNSMIEELRRQGIVVATPKCDVSVAESFTEALEPYNKTMPPIRGCINAAMVLNDSTFDNLTHAQWEQTIRSKAHTSWNLHALLPRDLDFFILLSSVSGIIGNPGQSNYAAGCTFQDSLAYYRNFNCQTAVSIDLGVVRGAGVVAESESLQNRFSTMRDFVQVEIDQLTALLDMYCDSEERQYFSNDLRRSQIIMGIATPAELLSRGLSQTPFTQRSLFARFNRASGLPQNLESAGQVNYAALFLQSKSAEERAAIVVKSLAKKLARALSIKPEDVEAEASQPLHAFGVDSLVAVELRNWIAKEFAADMAVFDLMGGRSITTIGELVTKASQHQRPEAS